ncbi:MAG TPA: TolC family protein [Candidatus Polarisedimenticolia bacterium]|nr:TolC family protein [Candidatus Polarisedimenticolia bacterium]
MAGAACLLVVLAAASEPGSAQESASAAPPAGEGSAGRPASAPEDEGYDLPSSLGDLVSPDPGVRWQPPALDDYAKVLKTSEPADIDPDRRYQVAELIDLAERLNPETRVAWEHARQAAAGIGLVQSEYYPVLSLSALGGYQSQAFPAPPDVAPDGFFRADFKQALPQVQLRWLLLDFGRRGNSVDAAKERLLAANLGFNRRHQEVVFRVQRAFYALTSLNGKIEVAQSAVDSSKAVREAAERQLENGLATVPDVALARQQEAQAAFDMEDVLARQRDAQVALTDAIGLPPTTPIQVADFSTLPEPAALEDSVDQVIDQALARRPDLIAKVALLRSREAEVRRARGGHAPTLSLLADYNRLIGDVKVTGGNVDTGWFNASEPGYGAGLFLHWNIFEGNAVARATEAADADRQAAAAEVTAARDRAISEVWTAYTDVRLALRRLDTARVLVDASQKSYDASLESYNNGLSTLIDLLTARRELSRARFVELDTRLQLLNASAALAFGTGASTGPVPAAPAAR